EKSLSAVVEESAKRDRLVTQVQMTTKSVLHQGKSKNKSGRPDRKQQDQGKRSEITQKRFPPAGASDYLRQPHQGHPAMPIEPRGQLQGALQTARQAY